MSERLAVARAIYDGLSLYDPKRAPIDLDLNDNTIMGIRVKNKKAFSVQYHPEASPGPHDSRYLFDEFVEMIKQDQLEMIKS